VEEFRTEDVARELGLDQQALIRLALLLGSDYTEGVAGIGIVNALEARRPRRRPRARPQHRQSAQGEAQRLPPVTAGRRRRRQVVRAFRGEDFGDFAEWVREPDLDALREAQMAGRRKAPRGKRKAAAAASLDDAPDADADAAAPEPAAPDPIAAFKARHRKLRKNWDLPAGFPSGDVVAAYLRARVDECRERFTMGRPDVPQLEAFCRDKFGWPAERVRAELAPVLKARPP
jgi:DNA excision repair protein ERCC-5